MYVVDTPINTTRAIESTALTGHFYSRGDMDAHFWDLCSRRELKRLSSRPLAHARDCVGFGSIHAPGIRPDQLGTLAAEQARLDAATHPKEVHEHWYVDPNECTIMA